MLELILGRAAEKRRECLLAKIAEIEKKKEYKILLLVPEQASFAYEKDILLQFGSKTASAITVCGFSRLAVMLLQEANVPVKPQIDEAARNVLMSLAVENATDSEGLYAAHAGREKLLSQLLSARDELRQACLSPAELGDASLRLQGDSLVRKTKELARIFDVYDAMVSQRFSDKSDNINQLTALLRERSMLTDTFVLAEGFRGFTEQQYRCMEQLVRNCVQVSVFLCTEPFAARQEDSAFAHSERARQRLHTIADKMNRPCREMYLPDEDAGETAVSYLREALYDPTAQAYAGVCDTVTVCSASDKYAECDYCAVQAARLIREEGYRARDIAVVERSTGTYAKTICAAFRRCGVPCFEDARRPLAEFPLVRLVLAACEAACGHLTAETLMKALKTGLTGVTVEECALLENYIRLWQLDGARLCSDFNGHPRGFGKETEERDVQLLSRINDVRKKAVDPILRLRKEIDGADGPQACTAVYRYLERTNAAEALRSFAQRLDANGQTHAAVESGRIWDVLMELLDALQAAIGKQTMHGKRFAELLRIMINAADIGDIPDGIDEVAVGDAQRIRPDRVKVLFAVGANEGVFPAPADESGIFTQTEKMQLRRAQFMLGDTPEETCAQERLLVYSVLTAPSCRLYVTYSISDMHAATAYPSEIVGMLQRIFPSCTVQNAADLPLLERAVSEQTAFELAASVYSQNTELSASLRAYIDRKPLFADRLSAVDRAASGRSFVFEDAKNARLLFKDNMTVSPSRAESFYKCSFAYFCRYGLRLEKQGSAKLDASNNGLLIHYVLEKLLDRYQGGALAALAPQNLKSEIDLLCQEYIDRFMGGNIDMPLRLQWQLERARQTAYEIALRLRAEFGTSRFVTKDVELTVRADGKVHPLTVDTEDGSITVAGIVDRVDVMEEDGRSYVRVIDYKTGGKNFRLSDLESGLNMQMLLYLMCLWDHGASRYGDVVPAGILYVPAKTGKLELPRNATAEEIEKQKCKNGKMNGLVLSEKNVILGMDSTGAGVYINASIDKNGNIKGSVASLEEFYRIHRRIEELLGQMHRELRNGSFFAVPVEGSGYKDICRYCDYAAVCCREHTDAVKRIDAQGEDA